MKLTLNGLDYWEETHFKPLRISVQNRELKSKYKEIEKIKTVKKK